MSGPHLRLLLRDRSGWRPLPLHTRLRLFGAGPELATLAETDLPLADAPAGSWLRLRREGDALLAVGAGALHVGQPPLDGRPRVLGVGDVLRLGAVAIVVLEADVAESDVHASVAEARLIGAEQARSGSPAVWTAWGELLLAAGTDWPLLLLGESGTGKELAARLVHRASPRRDGPWVAISAAALPPGTLHAELFGARRGAYTGSVGDREGAFGRADGGTLLIDEVGELDAVAQAALLRVLESGEITPLGGETRRVDVRVVAATHRDLAAMVEAGRFRLDLYHRLAVAAATLPPLRERGDDAIALLERGLGRPLDAAGRAVVRAHDWPGNLRELRNVGRRVALSIADGEPTAADVAASIAAGAIRARVAAASQPRLSTADRRRRVAEAISLHGSTAVACRASGLSRASFYRLLRELREAGDVSVAGPVDGGSTLRLAA